MRLKVWLSPRMQRALSRPSATVHSSKSESSHSARGGSTVPLASALLSTSRTSMVMITSCRLFCAAVAVVSTTASRCQRTC